MKLTVFIDGACEPINPNGHGACAFAAFEGEVAGRESDARPVPFKTAAKLIGEGPGMTNNIAEYRALRGSLQWLVEHGHGGDEIDLRMDSQLVVNQVNGAWECRASNLQPYCRDCRAILLLLPQARLRWVPREENFVPDDLINRLYASHGIPVLARRG